MCALLSMSFVAPSHKQHCTRLTLPDHNIHVRLYECGSGVCYLQQLPLGLCLPLFSVYLRDLAPVCALYFRAQLYGLNSMSMYTVLTPPSIDLY